MEAALLWCGPVWLSVKFVTIGVINSEKHQILKEKIRTLVESGLWSMNLILSATETMTQVILQKKY